MLQLVVQLPPSVPLRVGIANPKKGTWAMRGGCNMHGPLGGGGEGGGGEAAPEDGSVAGIDWRLESCPYQLKVLLLQWSWCRCG